MDDNLSLHDPLPPALQTQLDKTVKSGENSLMTLTGASGEALVVTDHRVIILREQMPIVGSDTQVDCFDYSYEQLQTVTVESAAGGGHLKLVLVAPPPDEQHVTLYFPAYEQHKFEVAAARIRLLTEQTRGVPAPPSASAPPAPSGAPICSRCHAQVRAQDFFCSRCGTALARACAFCSGPVRTEEAFCSGCGTPANQARDLACAGCGHSLPPFHVFCPSCGRGQVPLCARCGLPSGSAWTHCAHCGAQQRSLPTTLGPASPASDSPGSDGGAGAVPKTAEEHNEMGMRYYQQDRYEDAVREFEAALDLAPGTPIYHCNLGVAYADMGRDEEALEEYQVAMRLAPSDPTAYLNLGYFYAAREETKEARGWWQKAVEVAPSSPEAQEALQNLDHVDDL